MASVLPGIGWPSDEEPLPGRCSKPRGCCRYHADLHRQQGREGVIPLLEELREEVAPEWGVKRGTWNFAILVAKGLVRSVKKEK